MFAEDGSYSPRDGYNLRTKLNSIDKANSVTSMETPQTENIRTWSEEENKAYL